jgi:flagellar motor switch protein FliM
MMKILSQAEIDAMLEKLLSNPSILPGHAGEAKTGQNPVGGADGSKDNDKKDGNQ